MDYANSDEYWARKKLGQEKAKYGLEDLSGSPNKGVAETNWLGQSNLTQNEGVGSIPGASSSSAASGSMGAAQGAQQAVQSGGSPLDAAGAGLTTAGMATANPYLVAAGLATTALSKIQSGKNQREQNKYTAEVEKYNQRQQALGRLSQISQGLKA